MAELEGHGAPGRALNAALESATADLDRPVAPDVAPDSDGVGVNATLPSLGPAALAEAAQQSVESGFETLKVKAGAERETEVLVERIRAIRTAVGPDVRLRSTSTARGTSRPRRNGSRRSPGSTSSSSSSRWRRTISTGWPSCAAG